MKIKCFLNNSDIIYIFNKKEDKEIMEITMLKNDKVIITDQMKAEFKNQDEFKVLKKESHSYVLEELQSEKLSEEELYEKYFPIRFELEDESK